MKRLHFKKNLIAKFLDEFLRVLKTIFNNIFVLNFPDLIRFFLQLIIIFLTILITHIPFEIIKNIGNNTFLLLFNPINNVVGWFWTLIINVIYTIFSAVLFVFLFNKIFEKDRLNKTKKADYNEVFTDLYQVIIFVISLPLILLLIIFTILFLLSLYLISIGISYFSTLLFLIGLIGLVSILLSMIYNYLKRHIRTKKTYKFSIIIFVIIIVLGSTLFAYEMKQTKFYRNQIPNIDFELKNQTLETNIDLNVKVVCNNCYRDYDVIYDNNLNNKIVIEIGYYSEFVETTFKSYNNVITISGEQKKVFNDKIKDTIINDLKTKKIHDYAVLNKQRLTIWIDENNSDNLEVVIK